MDKTDKMRRSLKAADDLELPMSDDFFDQLHSKIMAEVEKSEMAPPPAFIKQRVYMRNNWRGWAYSTGSISSVILVAMMLSSQIPKLNQVMQRAGLLSDGRERIVAEAIQMPDLLSQTLISSQTEADFFVDVASESFENLSVAKFNQLMGEKSTH